MSESDDTLDQSAFLDWVSEDDLPVCPDFIGRYRVEAVLGKGGFGLVYLAHDDQLGRRVAIKVPHARLISRPEDAEIYLAEARTVASLDHPNIVPVYDVGSTKGVPCFVVSKYVEGLDLAAKIRAGRVSCVEAAGIVATVADALHYAHQQGFVHRDVKPGNILIGKDGMIHVVDFGLSVRPGVTSKELAHAGTPAYMSPEQARPSGGRIDGRSDVFSLGVVLYELLAGCLPFRGETRTELLEQVLTAEPRPIREHDEKIPKVLEDICRRALSKRLSDRSVSASEMAGELRQFLASGIARERIPEVRGGLGEKGEKSIAVLPFVNMSSDPEQDYFCDGISEDIIDALTRVASLRVAARTSSFAFRGRELDIREIAKQLNVGALLEGSVRKVGHRIRVTAQLIRAEDGFHQWSERYDRELDDIFAIQDEISSSIVQALSVEINDSQRRSMERTATKSIEAYEFYLRGRQLFDEGRSKVFSRAIELFTRATQCDPNYALAYAGIADCYSWLHQCHGADESTALRALDASRRAVELAPESSEAQTSRGLALFARGQADEAQRHFEEAIRLNPNSFDAFYTYARARFRLHVSTEPTKFLQRTAELFQRAADLRPDESHSLGFLGNVYHLMGDSTLAEAALRESLERCERKLAISPGDARTRILGANTLASLGRREEALEWSERALSLDPDDAHLLFNVACVHALCGATEDALSYLGRAVEAGYRYRNLIEMDSDFDGIRDDPRFKALLEGLD